MDGTASPTRRTALKGTIYLAGYDQMRDFAKDIGVSAVRVSAYLNGREFPAPSTQRRMAKCLGLTIKELGELL
jgi:transcriptional regulator with XRE-family HTH domain